MSFGNDSFFVFYDLYFAIWIDESVRILFTVWQMIFGLKFVSFQAFLQCY